MTDINEIIGKKLSLDVAEDVKLNIVVLNEEEVMYRFVGSDDNAKDSPVVTKLEIAYDDIEGIKDYSFTDGIATRFFLFQFAGVNEY